MLPGMGDISGERLQIDVAPPALRRAALELALSSDGEPPAKSIIDRAYAEAETTGDEWRGLLVARVAPANVVGATLVRHLAGQVSSVAVPQVRSDAPPQTMRRLVAHAVACAEANGSILAQSLVDPDDCRAAATFADEGFHRVADLLYLVWRCEVPPPIARAAGSLQWALYRPEHHARLAALVERTYLGSRDCPQLDGVRAMEDV